MIENASLKPGAVSVQWKNPDFLLRNPDFLLRNPDFLLKNVEFIIKQSSDDGESALLLGTVEDLFGNTFGLSWCERVGWQV